MNLTELLLSSALLSAGVFTAGFLLFGLWRRKTVAQFGVLRYSGVCGASSALCFAALVLTGVAVETAVTVRENFLRTFWPVLLTEALLFCVFTLCTWALRQPVPARGGAGFCPLLKTSCAIAAACLFCEIFLFNYLSFVPALRNLSAGSLRLDRAAAENVSPSPGGGATVGENGGSLFFDGVDQKICCFRIQTEGSRKVCNVTVEIEDENLSAQTYFYGSYDFCADSPRTTVLPVYSAGKMKAVRLTFDGGSGGLRIRSITFNQPDFFFSFGRFLLLSALAVGLFLIVRTKVWTISYDPESGVHNILIALLAVFLCFISVSLGKTPTEEPEIAYPLREAPEAYGCYVQQFDAFRKGRLDLDLTVDPKLKAMENPYDYSARIQENVSFSWDRSYCNGKYYSYFGVVPVFVVYYPYYFLHHALPADLRAGTALALYAVPFLILLIRELALRYCKKINLLLLLIGMAAAVFSSLLFMLQISSDFYYIAYLSEVLFLAVFLFLALRADRTERPVPRAVLLFLCGVSYVLAVGSRPVAALFLLLVLPIFFGMLRDREQGAPYRVLQLCAFAVPVLLGAAAIMAYNAARFGSPFEFGTTYQLTVDNMKYNRFSVLNIIPAVHHYFLQLPYVDPRFPFLHAADKQMNYYASYKLHVVMLGMLSFPCVWWIFGMRRVPVYRERKDARIFFGTVVLLSLLIAVVNYSVSGTNIRYVTDFSWILSALSVVVILDFDRIYTGCGSLNERILKFRSFPYLLSCVSLAASVLIGAAAIFSNERYTIYFNDPSFYANLERLFQFW